MTAKQDRTSKILDRVVSHSLTVSSAAELLGLTVRQVRRKVVRYRSDGTRSVIHANTGRTPANKTPSSVVDEVLALASEGGAYKSTGDMK